MLETALSATAAVPELNDPTDYHWEYSWLYTKAQIAALLGLNYNSEENIMYLGAENATNSHTGLRLEISYTNLSVSFVADNQVVGSGAVNWDILSSYQGADSKYTYAKAYLKYQLTDNGVIFGFKNIGEDNQSDEYITFAVGSDIKPDGTPVIYYANISSPESDLRTNPIQLLTSDNNYASYDIDCINQDSNMIVMQPLYNTVNQYISNRLYTADCFPDIAAAFAFPLSEGELTNNFYHLTRSALKTNQNLIVRIGG